MMHRLPIRALVPIILTVALFDGVYACFSLTMPEYIDNVGSINHTEKITGLHLLKQSAAREDNIIIYGSSELAAVEGVSTHPTHFFSGKRGGIQVNLVGRGSCQSIIHAMSIAASGDALRGQRIVLITSPQSYVPQGIAPDLFMANFSPRQYLELLAADDISPEVKRYISARAALLFERYRAMPAAEETSAAMRWLAAHNASPSAATSARDAAMRPYYAFSRYLFNLRDLASSRALINSVRDVPRDFSHIDWDAEMEAALTEARIMSSNNDFGMLNDYYTTNIGTRLPRFENRDAAVNYDYSEEYDDLRILFEICRQKGVEPLFVHIPFDGQWSDFTGLTAERRQVYYDNVRAIAGEFGIEILDLTAYEYEKYFLCDIVHLGWKGWLHVNRAIIEWHNQR
jgi:D-alanine transfer protein